MKDNFVNIKIVDSIDKLTTKLSEPKILIVGNEIGNANLFKQIFERSNTNDIKVIMSNIKERK